MWPKKPITIHRALTAQTFDHGLLIADSTRQDTSALAVVWELSPEAIARLPEGFRTEGVIKIVSTFPLYADDEASGLPADQITWGSRRFIVSSVADYSKVGTLRHYETTATLMKTP